MKKEKGKVKICCDKKNLVKELWLMKFRGPVHPAGIDQVR